MITLLEIETGSARYASADGSAIDCWVKLSHLPDEWLPFTATADDPLPHAQAVWSALQAGDAGEIAAYVPRPEPVPQSITMRQLLIGLMGAEWITPAEADAWSASGTLPATITAVIDDLPTEAERVAARITARRMSSAYRNDPLLVAAAQAAMPDASEQEISDALDQAFREWSAL